MIIYVEQIISNFCFCGIFYPASIDAKLPICLKCYITGIFYHKNNGLYKQLVTISVFYLNIIKLSRCNNCEIKSVYKSVGFVDMTIK